MLNRKPLFSMILIGILFLSFIPSTQADNVKDTNKDNIYESSENELIGNEMGAVMDTLPQVPSSVQKDNQKKGLPHMLSEYEELQISSSDMLSEFLNKKDNDFELILGLNKLNFQYTIEELDMSKYTVIGKEGRHIPANLEQIYHVKSIEKNIASIFISETSLRGSVMIENDMHELKPSHVDGKFVESSNYILYNEKKIYDPQPYYEKVIDRSRPDFVYEEALSGAVTLATTYTVDVVRSSSASFYDDHGSSWATELNSIWDGGGSYDPKTALENELDVSFSIQHTFTFVSGGPDDTDACTFLEEFYNFIDGLPSSDSAYDPDWGWMISGHDFDGSTIGCAYLGSLNNSHGSSVNEAKDGATRQVRNSMMHEGGHVMISSTYNHHGDGETNTKWCGWKWYYERTVMDTPYRGGPICIIPGMTARFFFFSSTNRNHANTYIANAGL